jgi:large subunit ribosomal protein L29
LDLTELKHREEFLLAELFNLRVQLAVNQLKNVKRPWAVKKQIARIKTVIREKNLSVVKTLSER